MQSSRVTLIEPTRGWLSLDLGAVWEYRELLYFLIWRDLKVRYKQTALGASWIIVQPLATMIVFSVVFGRLAGLPSDGIPYPIFSYAGLLPWNYFSSGVARSGNSLVSNGRLITKVYFPRLVIPIAAAASGIVDFGVAFVILLGLMAFYGVAPTIALLALPAFLLMAAALGLGVGLWLSAINVRYRDVGFAMPFLLQLWMFLSPVAYATSLVPANWQWVYALNPMAGVVEGFRWALLGTAPPSGLALAVSLLIVGIALVSGSFAFTRMERDFADVV